MARTRIVTIEGALAKLNEHDEANRSNRFAGAALKKKMTELVANQVGSVGVIESPCRLGFAWYYSSRHDFDNIRFAAKYVLDGLVKAGVLPNDNQKWVLGFDGDDFLKVDKGRDKVVVTIREIAS